MSLGNLIIQKSGSLTVQINKGLVVNTAALNTQINLALANVTLGIDSNAVSNIAANIVSNAQSNIVSMISSNVTSLSTSITSVTNNLNTANLTLTTAISSTDSNLANLTLTMANVTSGNAIPYISWMASRTGTNQVFSNVTLKSYNTTKADGILVQLDGITLTPYTDYTYSSGNITVLSRIRQGQTISVPASVPGSQGSGGSGGGLTESEIKDLIQTYLTDGSFTGTLKITGGADIVGNLTATNITRVP